MRPAAGAPRPGEISTPIAIVSILAALAVLAAVVLFFVTRDHGTSSDSTVSNASAAVATPVRSTSTGPTTSGTPLPGALPPGADKTFPKVSGDWTLFTVTIDKDAAGNFTGTGVIRYDGDTGATGVFDLAVFSGGRQVGTLHAGLSDVKPHTQTTVTWTSGDTWVEQMDGFAFHAS